MHVTKTASKRFFIPKSRKYIESHADLLLLIACILVLSIVPLLRPEASFLIGREPYLLLRLADNPSTWDGLSYGGRFAAYNWGTPLLASIRPVPLAQFLPPLIGLLSFLLFWGILGKTQLEPGTRRIALAITLLSPPFIYLFSTLNSYFIAIFLSLLGTYYFMSDKQIVAALSFIIMPIFNLPIAVISIILLFVQALSSRKKDQFWVIFICTAVITTAYYLTLAKYAGSIEKLLFPVSEFGISSALQNFFSDLGGKFGLSIFGTILALIGIIYAWSKKYSDLGVFFSIAALFILMFFSKQAIFFMNFYIAVLAAHAITTILRSGWESQTMKNFTLLVIVCGLLFSAVSFASRHAYSDPSEKIVEALNFFKEMPDGVAFSHYTRGFWLEYAGKKTVMDDNFAFAPDVNQRWQDSEKLLKTRSIDEAMEIISKYDIRYVWLDRDLRANLWGREEEGLQFLLEYSNKFKKRYIADEVQIWEVAR